MTNEKNWVYILECSDNSYYTGQTSSLTRRLKEHEEGKGSRYVKGRLPFRLVYIEKCNSKSEAMKREAEVKRMKRKKKEELVEKSGWRVNKNPINN